MEAILIAPCGMNCGICAAYLAGKHDLKKQGVGMGYCAGCRPRGKNCAWLKRHCEKLGQGHVAYCYVCDDYPCRRLRHLDQRYRLNYGMSMLDNLDYIKKHGMVKFLEDQAEKWRCGKCGGVTTCHGEWCFKCDIEELKAFKGPGRYKLKGVR